MKTVIAAICFGFLLAGTVNAGYKGCRNDLGTCKCKCNYSTTLSSTGTFLVDLSKGPVWINFNPQQSGDYQFKVYKKSIAMSLSQCGKSGYVRSVYKKDSCSNSMIAELCKKGTYRFYLCRARSSDDTVILVISKADGCSKVRRISSVTSRRRPVYYTRSYSSNSRPSSSSCSTSSNKSYYTRSKYYRKHTGSRYYYTSSGSKRNCSTKSGIGFTIKF